MRLGLFVSVFLIAAALSGSALYQFFGCSRETYALIQAAEKSYAEGERSQTPAARIASFNKALEGYQKLEQNGHPLYGSGKLYYNLGNTYYQLEQYPWAVLYYSRAQKLMPRDDKTAQNLKVTLAKLQQPFPPPPTVWQTLFLIGPLLSVPEALQIFAILGFLCFFLGSLMIWAPSPWWKWLLFLALCPLLFFAASLGYQRYFAPLEAVVVKATPIYRDAGTQYSQVQNDPLPGGLKVEILQLMPAGDWVKVSLKEGTIGFVPIGSIRLI